MIHKTLADRLRERETSGNLRKLKKIDGIDLASNDYLGLARSEELMKLRKASAESFPVGSTGSRLLTGNHEIHEQMEQQLAGFFRSEKALLFNSGYTANLALLSALPRRGDTILFDARAHASIKDGMRLSHAGKVRFAHNDAADLERKLQRAGGDIFVVIESVYSMDGTIADFHRMVELCEKYGAGLIVDEAHSSGIYGSKGEGVCVQEGLQDRVLARVHTFGKAFGAHGACLCGNGQLIDFIINFSRPFIYSTALPPAEVRNLEIHLNFIRESHSQREKLNELIQYFRSGLEGMDKGKWLLSSTPIQGLLIQGNQACREAAAHLEKSGFAIFPVLHPTVPEGEERLRICLHSFNSEEEIDRLFDALHNYFKTSPQP